MDTRDSSELREEAEIGTPVATGTEQPEAGETRADEGGDEPVGERPSILREYTEALLVAILFALFARTFLVQAFKIPSESMAPNLLVGDHLLVNKFIYGPAIHPLEERLLPLRLPKRGDVVVFKFPREPKRDFIKRCVGLPGDLVEIESKKLSIGDREIDESAYVHFEDSAVYSARMAPFLEQRYRVRDTYGPETIPEHSYFCLGDNRDNSDDSRFWGPVPRSFLRGRAVMVYWSFELPDNLAPGQYQTRLGQLGTVARNFASNTRWERTFRLVR